jgi:hypothetical protein
MTIPPPCDSGTVRAPKAPSSGRRASAQVTPYTTCCPEYVIVLADYRDAARAAQATTDTEKEAGG